MLSNADKIYKEDSLKAKVHKLTSPAMRALGYVHIPAINQLADPGPEDGPTVAEPWVYL